MNYRGTHRARAMQSGGRDCVHIVQSLDVSDQAGQLRRHRRIGSVPEIRSVGDNLGRKGRLGGRDAARGRDRSRTAIDFRDCKARIGEPLLHRIDLRRGRAEVLVEFRSAQPLMIFGRSWILLRGQQLLERSLIMQAKHDVERKLSAAVGARRICKTGDIRGMVPVNFHRARSVSQFSYSDRAYGGSSRQHREQGPSDCHDLLLNGTIAGSKRQNWS